MAKGLRSVPPPVTLPVDPTRVPDPPSYLSTLEREVWNELAPQVSSLKVYDSSMLTAFRLLVVQVTEALHLPEDAPDTARARAYQSAQMALRSWGLTPVSRSKATKAEAAEGKHGRWRRR